MAKPSSAVLVKWAAAAVMLLLAMAVAVEQAEAVCSAPALLASCGSGVGIPSNPRPGCCNALRSAGLPCVCNLLKQAQVAPTTQQNYIRQCRFGNAKC